MGYYGTCCFCGRFGNQRDHQCGEQFVCCCLELGHEKPRDGGLGYGYGPESAALNYFENKVNFDGEFTEDLIDRGKSFSILVETTQGIKKFFISAHITVSYSSDEDLEFLDTQKLKTGEEGK